MLVRAMDSFYFVVFFQFNQNFIFRSTFGSSRITRRIKFILSVKYENFLYSLKDPKFKNTHKYFRHSNVPR